MLYGFVGPHCNIYGYLDFEADIWDDPWWELYAGLDVTAGLQLEIITEFWSATYSSPEFDIINYRTPEPIAQADGPFGGIPDVSGNWSGNYSTNLITADINFVNIIQSGINFSGTFNDSEGTIGTISGEYNGTAFNFTMTQTNIYCSGSFNGIVYISGDTLTFTFTGYNCLGTHENGMGTLTR